MIMERTRANLHGNVHGGEIMKLADSTAGSVAQRHSGGLAVTAAMADVVLPVTQWAEETGTMTNLEGRVILRERAVAPPEGVRSDLEVPAAGVDAVLDPLERDAAAHAGDYDVLTWWDDVPADWLEQRAQASARRRGKRRQRGRAPRKRAAAQVSSAASPPDA